MNWLFLSRQDLEARDGPPVQAHLDADQTVISVVTMAPHRIGRPRLRSRAVVEAEAGELTRWGVEPGVQLEVRS